VYGTELFAGYYRGAERLYYFMPLYPLWAAAALRQIAPDYVLADPIVSIKHSTPPGPDIARQIEGFDRFLAQYCATKVFSSDDRDYGPLVLYRCDTGAP
jgi:hypothetical protein